MFPLLRQIPVAYLLSACVGSSSLGEASPRFDKDVAPLLEMRCLSCHNEVEKKGELDLSQKDSVIGNVIASGSPDDSKLFHAISGPEPEMPKTGKQLTPEQASIVRDWIAAGAEWPSGRVAESSSTIPSAILHPLKPARTDASIKNL